ncbi:YhgE/Pip domain-containing protein [Microbacterium thalli]|uniref:YhgE/Pip family protein n=1 Tax=Microbacterium thalli TaxID=3027921 RepID=A0ABT5SFM1_9MICO|nr:YhgE/Pip family protein [Microbacterium thalli]MDD7961564.1 YhgE/Pip family protein [Microbacterium thalli]
MTLPIERARTRKPITWLTILGVILLPVLVGGVLVAALYNPVERLDNMSAAIVNNDEPVEINGQLAPLGRQLTAGLVEGSDDVPSNLAWVISNDDDAAAGLADGTYDAVVTIPSGFSSAATSTAPGGTPEKATIRVETAPDSLVVDDAIVAQITQAATSLTGSQLSTVYLENVFLGFTTLGDQLGEAAGGAGDLADGTAQLADGVAQLDDGAQAAADGAAQLPAGAGALSSGAADLADGAGQLATGLGALGSGARDAATGAQQLAAGVRDGAAQIEQGGLVPAELTRLAQGAATTSADAARQTGAAAQTIGQLAATCIASGASPAFCTSLGTAAGDLGTAATAAVTAATGAGYTSGGLDQFAAQAPQQIAGQLRTIADNADALAGGVGQVADGAGQSAAGAAALADGATQLADGAGQLATGSESLASGIRELADGTGELRTGTADLAGGSRTLADGLGTAVEQIPSYTDQQATDLASVVAAPVEAEGLGSELFGASAIPLLTGLALWLGAIASFIALQAVPRAALTSRRPSFLLALRAFAPAAVVGLVQGVLVAVVVQLAASYDPWTWAAFAGLSALAGVAFAAINQALVAVLGGAGRWVAAGVAVLAVATGVVSTVPGVLSQIASLLPTASAYQGLLAVLTSTDGAGAAVGGLIVWLMLSLIVTVLVTARARTTSVRALLRRPATA